MLAGWVFGVQLDLLEKKSVPSDGENHVESGGPTHTEKHIVQLVEVLSVEGVLNSRSYSGLSLGLLMKLV